MINNGDFEYAGEKLSDYGMMMCYIGGLPDSESSSGADITYNLVKPSKTDIFNLYSSTYNEAYSTEFCIGKRSCSGEDIYMSTDEVSQLQRWLCRDRFHKFKVYEEGYENLYWNASFASKQIKFGEHIIGLSLTMFCDSPFAYVDKVTNSYSVNAGETFDLYDFSDEEGFVYPDMKIKILEAGLFKLENSQDRKIFKVNNCSIDEVLTIDGRYQILTSSLDTHNVSGDFNYYFPRIFNTYENNLNRFKPSLKCEIEFIYSPIKKIGL